MNFFKEQKREMTKPWAKFFFIIICCYTLEITLHSKHVPIKGEFYFQWGSKSLSPYFNLYSYKKLSRKKKWDAQDKILTCIRFKNLSAKKIGKQTLNFSWCRWIQFLIRIKQRVEYIYIHNLLSRDFLAALKLDENKQIHKT